MQSNKNAIAYVAGDKTKIRLMITSQMLLGAFWASVVVVGAGVFVFALYLVGTLLPPESKEAEDPSLGFNQYQYQLIAPETDTETRVG